MFSASAPLASHFTLPSRACTDGPGNMSQATTKDPSYPEAYWKDSQGGCTQSSQGSLVVQKCLTSVLFNYNTGQGHLETIPGDSSGVHEPTPKFPDFSELECPLGAQAIRALLLVGRKSAADANAPFMYLCTH